MKRFIFFAILFFPGLLLAQEHTSNSPLSTDFNFWFSLLEIPFLIFVITLSFMVASLLKGGKFGSGMSLLAWGFLVMAIGHIHMQVEHITGFNLFKYLFGNGGGTFAWFFALIITWTLSGLGFYRIYVASRM